MSLNNYQVRALRTEAPQPTLIARLEHAALGLISEPGEIATQIKRIVFYGKTLDSLDKDKTLRMHIAEEIGDTMWYMAIAGDVIGYDVFAERMAAGNINATATLKTSMFALQRAAAKFTWTLQLATEGDLTGPYIADHLDLMAYALLDLASLIGISIEQIADENIDKLALRYPDKFTAEAAEARADKGGLDARNS